MEEIVIYQRGTFDLAAEVDVFAAHLQLHLRTARNHQLLIADKTIINVLAYARMLLDVAPDSLDGAVLAAMEIFCRAWAPTYDLVFFTPRIACGTHTAAQPGKTTTCPTPASLTSCFCWCAKTTSC